MLKVHLIFVTRFRRPLLTEMIALDCKQYLETIAEEHHWSVLKMETDIDHVHILIQYAPTDCISHIVKVLKQQSTYWMWQKHGQLLKKYYWYQNTLWSKGYFYCSIGDVSSEIIERYIENQG